MNGGRLKKLGGREWLSLAWFKLGLKAETWVHYPVHIQWTMEPTLATAYSFSPLDPGAHGPHLAPCLFLQIKFYWNSHVHSSLTPLSFAALAWQAELKGCGTETLEPAKP